MNATDTDTAELLPFLQQQLLARIRLQGLTLTGVSRSMDRAHNYLARKLDPTHPEPRQRGVEDVQDVCRVLGVDWRQLFTAPVDV